jgi:hypothetical protein
MSTQMTMTCGQGLAHHSHLPAGMSGVLAAMATHLEIHMTALDLSDENARKERAAYSELATGHRRAAEQLQDIAMQMAGYQNLPPARHDMWVMTSANVAASFETVTQRERELLALLQTTVSEHEQMLSAMHGEQSSPV